MGRSVDDGDYSSSSSSSSSDDDDDSRRRRRPSRKDRKKKSKKRKSRHRDDDDDIDDDIDDDKRRSKKIKRRKKRYESSASASCASDDASASAASCRDESSSDSERDRKRRKKKKKKHRRRKEEKKARKKKTSRKNSRRRDDKEEEDDDDKDEEDRRLERNYQLADALMDLLQHHAPMGADLPVILVRLAGGTTFDLSQMQPSSAARGLERVLVCLAPFGVHQTGGSWAWKSPTGAASHTNTNELALVRLVRAMLDQMGMTMEAIEAFENPNHVPSKLTEISTNQSANHKQQSATPPPPTTTTTESPPSVEEVVKRILDTFEKTSNTLSGELAGLCQMILEGESISLDGLPDDNLRTALEGLLDSCGLEKAEMDQDDDDDDDGEPSIGFSLPEHNETSANAAQQSLRRVVAICKTVAARPSRVHGPKRPPTNYQAPAATAALSHNDDDNDDDEYEGPSIVPRAQTIALAADLKAQAARRQRELSHVAAGQGPLPADTNDDGREEWMLTPGKSDFFDFIKRGEPMKGRKFQSKAKGGAHDDDEQVMDPEVRAEMEAIQEAHQSARGPSLMAEHQAAKKEAAAAAAAAQSEGKGNKKWNWNRNNDLDAGRRVDKDALQMVLGGAATGLKSKFQGGFHGTR